MLAPIRHSEGKTMKLNLSADQLLSTTRTVRKRLDLTKPVPRAVIEECLDLALQAPNGSNRNEWRWVVVDDPALIKKLADIYRGVMTEITGGQTNYRTETGNIPHYAELMESVEALMGKLDRVPVMLIPLMAGRPDGKAAVAQASMWGSILPAVWSLFLALRERGLGAAWTTISIMREKEIADLLGIPHDQYTQAGLFPIAYTVGTEFKKAWRKPLKEVMNYNKF
jgi:nitroreductase